MNIQGDQIVHNYQFKNYCIEHLIIHGKLWAQLSVRFYACLLEMVVYDVTFFNGKMKNSTILCQDMRGSWGNAYL